MLDFRSGLDLAALVRACGKGKPGSAALKRAIARHQPELAHTNGPLERDFLLWLETLQLPIPKFNRTRCGIVVDAVYDELKLIIELDGAGNHHSHAQLARDAHNAETLERAGYVVLRFTHVDLHGRPETIRAKLAAHGVVPG